MAEPVRILHVDDEPGFADLTATYLERERPDFTVATATSAADGLDVLAHHEIDCIVSDYEMPGQDGIEFLESVEDAGGDCPFILFTGRGSEEVASDAIAAGVTDYLQKGSGPDRYTLLANRIANAVDQHRAERQAERTARRYRRLIEESTDVITVVDENGQFSYLSASTERLLGYPADTLHGENGFAYIHPDDREAAMEAFADVVEHPERRVTHEFRFKHAEGRWIWLEVRARNLREDPEIQGIVVYARDVTDRITRERERRDATRQLQGLLDGVKAAVWMRDAENRFVLLNQTFRELFGIEDEDEVIGTPPEELFSEEVAATFLENDRRVWESADTIEFEEEVLTPRGLRTYLTRITPIADDDGEIQATCGVATDITARKEREQALRRYQRLIETVDDAVYALDEDGNFLLVNDATATLTGYERDELIGEHASKVIGKSDVERTETLIEELMSGSADRSATCEVTVRTKRGVEIPCDVRFSLLGSRTESSFRGSVGIARDITERRERERELGRARDRMEFALEVTDAMVWDWNVETDQATFYPSEESLYGTEVDSWDDFIEVIHPEDRERTREAISTALEMDEPKREEIRIVRDGEVRWIDAPGQPVYDEDGTRRMIGVARDVTQQKRNERRLERQNEQLERFASLVSHDLRNPLQVAQGQLTLAQEEHESDRLTAVSQALERMDQLTRDLLTLARNERGIEAMEPIAFPAVVERCWHNVRTADAALVTDLDGSIRADRSRLQQLLENLLRNAVEHGGDEVTIRVGELENAAGFYVEDDGPGIPADERERVFERGYSTDEGTGFGLPIVADIVDAHGWELTLTAGEFGGARFEIRGVAAGEGLEPVQNPTPDS